MLFKSLPWQLNRYLHEWHTAEVRRVLGQRSASDPLWALDLGCGYGRLSQAIRTAVPRAHLVGLDISPTFAHLYRQQTGGVAVLSDLDGLPVRGQTFDLVLVVTTLMYLAPATRFRLVSDCLRVLKDDGCLLIIENSRSGWRISSGLGVFPWLAGLGGAASSPGIDGHLFADSEIESLVEASGGTIAHRSGVVGFTLLLPLLVVLYKIGGGSVADRVLQWCRWSRGVRRYSVHVCYEVRGARRQSA